ncbi:hypothetical protein EII22_09290 [Coriobacteriales bacterium OH1046]|nr:hypothetical protein EII22_09290 [Coriobacteriales bacterium OH1046]
MIDGKLAKLLGAAALALTLAACNGGGSGTTTPADSDNGGSGTTQSAPADGTFDAAGFYTGQWRGSVEVTGQTVYGNAGGNEPMLDVVFAEDGTVEVTPLEAHADLPSGSGTWDGTEESVTLHLDSGDIILTVVDTAKLSGNAADFGIADFEIINFDFYG